MPVAAVTDSKNRKYSAVDEIAKARRKAGLMMIAMVSAADLSE